MAIDASIPLGVKPVQIDSPVNSLAQIAQVQGAQAQNSLLGLKMQEAQQGITDQAAMRAGLAAPGADPGQVLLKLGKIKEYQEYQKAQGDAQKQQVDLLDSKLKQSRAFLDNVQTPEQYIAWHQANHADPVLGPALAAHGVTQESSMASIQQALAQPGGFQDLLKKSALGLDRFTELNKPTNTVVPAGGTSAVMQTPGLGGPPQTVATVQHTATPGELLTEQAHKAQLEKDYTVAGFNPDGTPRQMPVAADGSLDLTKVSPEDLAAAHRYRADGTLPPNMGRGAQGAMESRKIRAIATALDAQAGESPEDARMRQLALKGDVQAVAALRKREVAIGANVKNFDFNADQVLQLSSKLDRTGVPIVNAWLNAGRRAVAGNPDLAAFDTAVKTTVNEFAQIVGGTTSGGSTEGEKKKAEALLNAQQTPEQIVAVINQMRVESKNRMESFARQRQESMPTNGPKPSAGGAAAAAGGKALVNAKGWTLHTDAKGNKAYVSPDGKQFEPAN